MNKKLKKTEEIELFDELPFDMAVFISTEYIELQVNSTLVMERLITEGFTEWYGKKSGSGIGKISQMFKSFIILCEKNEVAYYLNMLPKSLLSVRVDLFATFPRSFINRNLGINVLYGHDFPKGEELPKFTKIERLVCRFETFSSAEAKWINGLSNLKVLMIGENKTLETHSNAERQQLEITSKKITRFLYVGFDYRYGIRNGRFRIPLENLSNLKLLMLANVKITDTISKQIEKLTKLREIMIISCIFGEDSFHLFEHPSLRIIALIFSHVGGTGSKSLLSQVLLPDDTKVEEFAVSGMDFSGANYPDKFFEELLMKAKHLVFVDLSKTNVDQRILEACKKRAFNEDCVKCDIDVTCNDYFTEDIVEDLNEEFEEMYKVNFIRIDPLEAFEMMQFKMPTIAKMAMQEVSQGIGMGGPPPEIMEMLRNRAAAGAAGPPHGVMSMGGFGKGMAFSSGGPPPGILNYQSRFMRGPPHLGQPRPPPQMPSRVEVTGILSKMRGRGRGRGSGNNIIPRNGNRVFGGGFMGRGRGVGVGFEPQHIPQKRANFPFAPPFGLPSQGRGMGMRMGMGMTPQFPSSSDTPPKQEGTGTGFTPEEQQLLPIPNTTFQNTSILPPNVLPNLNHPITVSSTIGMNVTNTNRNRNGTNIPNHIDNKQQQQQDDEPYDFSNPYEGHGGFVPAGFTDKMFGQEENAGEPKELSWDQFLMNSKD